MSKKAEPLAQKTAGLIEKETFDNSDTFGFSITPTTFELTEIAENIFLLPPAAVNPDLCDL